MNQFSNTSSILRKVADFIAQEPEAYQFNCCDLAEQPIYQGRPHCVLGWANAFLPDPDAQYNLADVAKAMGFHTESHFYQAMRVDSPTWFADAIYAVRTLRRLANNIDRWRV